MADVFLAKDQLLDRPVAVKVLFPQFAAEPTFVARFRREAQAAANLNHPSIVAVYDWGEHEDTYFIVMEYVEGQTLAELIAGQGTIAPDRAAEIAIDTAAALGFAHRNGTVHRDVKPGNIMINQSGQVKVADFGIARAFGGEDDELTQTGSVMGTASYFSPEQAQGRPVDPRSDLYSLGVVLFEMLVGEPPFVGNSPVAIAYKHVQETPPPVLARNPAVPEPLAAIVDKLLRKDPTQRYPAAEEVRADLGRFRQGQPLQGIETQRPPVQNGAPPAVSGTDSTVAMPVNAAPAAAMPTRGADTGASRAVIDTSRAVPASAAVRQEEPVEEYYEPASRTGLFAVMLAILLAALVALILYISQTLEDGEDEDPVDVETMLAVPDVIGKSVTDAEVDLRLAGFEVTRQLEVNPDFDVNAVFDQNPKSGDEAEEGSTVTIFVSQAAETENVPRLDQLPLEEAEGRLDQAGLRSDRQFEFSDTVAEGLVIRTEPPENTEVNKGDLVTLIISNGPDQVEIPDLTNMDRIAAAAALTEAGFTAPPVFADEPSIDVLAGLVTRTEPPAAQRESIDTSITIFVSLGPSQVQVPDVANLSMEAAEAVLVADELRLVPTFTNVELQAGDQRIGLVLGTNPGAGAQILQGSEIQVLVGIEAPEVEPPPDTTDPGDGGGDGNGGGGDGDG